MLQQQYSRHAHTHTLMKSASNFPAIALVVVFTIPLPLSAIGLLSCRPAMCAGGLQEAAPNSGPRRGLSKCSGFVLSLLWDSGA